MEFSDNDLRLVINSGHKVTAEIADEVGATDTKEVAKRLGNLKRLGLINKNGQGQWFVVNDIAEDERQDPQANTLKLVSYLTPDLDLALIELKEQMERPPIPDFGSLEGLDVELATHLRLAELMDPSIADVLHRTHARLLAIHNYSQVNAA